MGHFPGSFAKISKLTEFMFLKHPQITEKSSVLLNPIPCCNSVHTLDDFFDQCILLHKRLTEKRFQWPRDEAELKKLTQQEFRWLMEGLSITQTKAFVPGKPGTVC